MKLETEHEFQCVLRDPNKEGFSLQLSSNSLLTSLQLNDIMVITIYEGGSTQQFLVLSMFSHPRIEPFCGFLYINVGIAIT